MKTKILTKGKTMLNQCSKITLMAMSFIFMSSAWAETEQYSCVDVKGQITQLMHSKYMEGHMVVDGIVISHIDSNHTYTNKYSIVNYKQNPVASFAWSGKLQLAEDESQDELLYRDLERIEVPLTKSKILLLKNSVGEVIHCSFVESE